MISNVCLVIKTSEPLRTSLLVVNYQEVDTRNFVREQFERKHGDRDQILQLASKMFFVGLIGDQ